MLLCSFGSGSASVLRLFSFSFDDASNTIQTLVVSLSGRTTGKCGRNHSLSGRGSDVGTYNSDVLFLQVVIYYSLVLAKCLSIFSFFSTCCNLLSAISLLFGRFGCSCFHGTATSYRAPL